MSDVVLVKGGAERGYGKRRIGRSAYGARCWRRGAGVLEWQAMDQLTVDRLKVIYWTMSEQDWLGHAWSDATMDLADIIRKYEPTIGPLGTPILETA